MKARPSAKLEVVEKKLERDRFSGWQLFAKVKNADQAAAKGRGADLPACAEGPAGPDFAQEMSDQLKVLW